MLNWLLPILLTFSISARTPKVQPNPFDYELSFGIEKEEQFYADYDFEREHGNYYHDYEFWVAHTFAKYVYLRERFLNKSSKDIRFNQFDVRWKYSAISLGYALKTNSDKYDSNLILGLNYKKELNHHFRFETDSEITHRLDYQIQLALFSKINENVEIVTSYGAFAEGSEFDFKFKAGLQLTLR